MTEIVSLALSPTRRTPRTRHRGLVRCLSLLRAFQGGRRATLQELAVELKACERTIRRDFQVLAEVGYPVCHTPESDIGVRGLWWIDPHDH